MHLHVSFTQSETVLVLKLDSVEPGSILGVAHIK